MHIPLMNLNMNCLESHGLLIGLSFLLIVSFELSRFQMPALVATILDSNDRNRKNKKRGINHKTYTPILTLSLQTSLLFFEIKNLSDQKI